MVSICDVRTLADFVQARILHSGFKNLDAFSREMQIPRPTLYRLLKAKSPKELGSQRATLERLALGLRFKEWNELERAWEDNDTFFGLDDADSVPVLFPRYAYEHAEAEAGKANVTLLEWMLKRMGLVAASPLPAKALYGRVVGRAEDEPPTLPPANTHTEAPKSPRRRTKQGRSKKPVAHGPE